MEQNKIQLNIIFKNDLLKIFSSIIKELKDKRKSILKTNDEYIKKAQDVIYPILRESSKHGDSAALFLVSSFTAILVNKLKEIDELKGKLKND